MKKNILLAVGFLAIANLLSAQIGADINLYSFSKVPEITKEEDARYAKDDFVFLEISTIYDYHFNQEDNFERSVNQHQIVKFYSNDGIEKYLGAAISDSASLIGFQARIIHPDGNMDFITRDSLISIQDTNTSFPFDVNISYKIDLNKLKVGDILDFFIIKKASMSYEGTVQMAWNKYIRDIEYTYILPSYLKMDVKVYNSDARPIDTVINNNNNDDSEQSSSEEGAKRYTYIAMHNVPALQDEDYSESARYSPRVEYTIAYNLSRGKSRITSINQYVSDIDNFMTNLDKKDIKTAQKIAKKIILTKSMSEIEKIQTIENYVRKNFVLFGYGNIRTISQMYQYGFGSGLGFLQLYNQLFKAYGIDNRVVWTTDNQEKLFDPTFEGNNFFKEVLFYFPDIDQYMAPAYNSYSVGLPPFFLTNNQGIMLEKFSAGGVNSVTPKVVTINPLPYSISYDSLSVNLSIDPVAKKISGSEERILGGYEAIDIQRNMKDYEIEDEEMLLESELGFGDENVLISGEKYLNNKPEDIGVRPLKMSAHFSTVDFGTYNTNSMEITIGAFIDKQYKLEEKSPRIFPFDLQFMHQGYRMIVVNIPDGYIISDQYKKLDTAVYDTGNAQTANAAFIVKTELQGNKLIVHCDEYYKQLHYEIAEYPNIKRIFDASADFNSKKIIFIKK